MTLIDKVAWIRLADGKILKHPVDQIIFDHLHGGGQLG
jgi:hypothetical protein